jgi:hypothetical protein
MGGCGMARWYVGLETRRCLVSGVLFFAPSFVSLTGFTTTGTLSVGLVLIARRLALGRRRGEI